MLLLHFVREIEYETDIALIEPNPIRLLALDEAVECRCSAMRRCEGYGIAEIPWCTQTFFAWYFEMGTSIYLLALKTNLRVNWQVAA